MTNISALISRKFAANWMDKRAAFGIYGVSVVFVRWRQQQCWCATDRAICMVDLISATICVSYECMYIRWAATDPRVRRPGQWTGRNVLSMSHNRRARGNIALHTDTVSNGDRPWPKKAECVYVCMWVWMPTTVLDSAEVRRRRLANFGEFFRFVSQFSICPTVRSRQRTTVARWHCQNTFMSRRLSPKTLSGA